MKIVVLDGYCENPGDLSWDELAALGELTVYDRTGTDEELIIGRSAGADILVTNKTPITRNVIENCPDLKYIAVLATGFNIIDLEAASERNIPVSNVPAYGTATVSQFAIGLLLEICHRIGHHSDEVRQGRWSRCDDFCFWDYPLIELNGKTMGIIGLGRIGKQTGRIASAMGMKVLATGSRETPEGAAIAEYTSLDDLLARSDVICLHCPLNGQTKGIINRDTIAKMKDGVILINNSRGPLIVEEDLAEALASGKVAAAGLDVLSQEPPAEDNVLFNAPNCFITPHISWASKEARERIMQVTLSNVRAFLSGAPENVVN